MERLILLVIITLPLYSLGLFISGKFISESHLFSIALVIAGFISASKRRFTYPRQAVFWTIPFIAFLLINVIGLLTSPYGTESLAKGATQILGILIVLAMGIEIFRAIYCNPQFTLKIARISSIALGGFSLIGCLQFFLWNFTPFDNILKFDILNEIAGGNVWRDPGFIGSVNRINSVGSEPTAFAQFLGFALGWALIRLGLLGQQLKRPIQNVIPLWSAIAISMATILTFSINAWILLACIATMLLFGSRRISLKYAIKSLGILIVFGSFAASIIMFTGGGLVSKAQTVSLIFSEDAGDSTAPQKLSSLSLAVNSRIAISNFQNYPLLGGGLGSHPNAYDLYAPNYIYNIKGLEGLNKDDAGSLFFRLLSETGTIGLALFCCSILWLILRARKAILLAYNSKNIVRPEYLALSTGIVSSMTGLFVIYMIRTGHYYDPVFWVLVALTASVPFFIRKSIALELNKKRIED